MSSVVGPHHARGAVARSRPALGEAEAIRAGHVLATLEASGRSIGVEDVLIGATALVRGLTVVTRNMAHLSRIPGLRVECWWD